MATAETDEKMREQKFELEQGVRTAREFAALRANSKLWPKVKKELVKEAKIIKSNLEVG